MEVVFEAEDSWDSQPMISAQHSKKIEGRMQLTLEDENKGTQERGAACCAPPSAQEHVLWVLHEEFPLEQDHGDEVQRAIHGQHPFEHVEEPQGHDRETRVDHGVHNMARHYMSAKVGWGGGAEYTHGECRRAIVWCHILGNG